MGKTTYMKLKGSQNLRLHLLLATLFVTPVLIKDIRHEDTLTGLRSYEVSLLRLFEEVCDDCVVKINNTKEVIYVFLFSYTSGMCLLFCCCQILIVFEGYNEERLT